MKVYVMADSLEEFESSVAKYTYDPEMDCTGLEFIYLTSVSQIKESRFEIWDCSGLRQKLNKLNMEIIHGM